MTKVGQVVVSRMTAGQPSHVRHISGLQWGTSSGALQWSTRADMVNRVNGNPPGAFFAEGGGTSASLYVVTEGNSSWVQTEPDQTKLDNLLSVPLV
jgi:hypothetical protein